MTTRLDDDRLRRLRLAAQRLTAQNGAADAPKAARTVVGVQAQNVRAAALALRSRVPGLAIDAIDASGLVRTWALRGTVHLIHPDDRPWLHAVLGARNRGRFDALMAQRCDIEDARAVLRGIVAVLEAGPRDRASLLAELRARGYPELGPRAHNVLAPWAASQGLVLSLPDGRLRAAEPPPPVDHDEALATLAHRYLAGYGPATAVDLASWAGLPVTVARRAIAALGSLDAACDLRALPGTLDAEPPPAPPALLLAAFDPTMLGYRTREPLVPAVHDRSVLPGGGILRPVVLARGTAAGTWRLEGSGARRTLAIDWFGRRAAMGPLEAEVRDVGRFLCVDLRLRM